MSWCTQVAARRKWQQDDSKIIQEVWEEERSKLLALPDDDYPAYERHQARVGKTPYVRFDKNDYSVPHENVRSTVTVAATDQQVRIFRENELIAEHPRTFSKGEMVENPAHTAKLFLEKRAAAESSAMSRLVAAAPSARTWLVTASRRGLNMGYQTKKLQDLLRLYGSSELEAGLRQFSERETVHLGTLERMLDEARAKQGRIPLTSSSICLPRHLEEVVVRPHSLDSYAVLRGQSSEEPEDD